MAIRPGDVVEVAVTYGAPHHLVADGPLVAHRRTRAGDAAERPRGSGTGLGLPGFGRARGAGCAAPACGIAG